MRPSLHPIKRVHGIFNFSQDTRKLNLYISQNGQLTFIMFYRIYIKHDIYTYTYIYTYIYMYIIMTMSEMNGYGKLWKGAYIKVLTIQINQYVGLSHVSGVTHDCDTYITKVLCSNHSLVLSKRYSVGCYGFQVQLAITEAKGYGLYNVRPKYFPNNTHHIHLLS